MNWDIWVKAPDEEWSVFETGVDAYEAIKVVTLLMLRKSFSEINIRESK